MKKNKYIKGQAVLVILLSLSVVLIVVLYIISRSITDISLSSKEEDSLRAFSAAEAGVERALVIGSDIGDTPLGDANFSADVSDFARGSSSVVFPFSMKSGEDALFWFVGHNSDGTLGCTTEACFTGNQARFCWGDPGTVINGQTPALEVTVYYRTPGTPPSGGEYRVARKMIDPNTGGRTQNNGYTAAGTCTIDGQVFQFQNTVSFGAGGLNIANFSTGGVLQYATAKFLYNTNTAHKIAIDVSGAGGPLLPSQGIKVNSSGNFADANRAIEVFQLHPETPPIFANSVYSSSGVTK